MAKMTTFRCRLRHGGVVNHEIPMSDVTDKEPLLLRLMHGQDAITGIEEDGSRTFEGERAEYFYLARKYANTADPYSGMKLVAETFKVSLHEFPNWLAEQQEIEQMEREEAMERRQREAAERQRQAGAEALRAALLGEGPVPAAT